MKILLAIALFGAVQAAPEAKAEAEADPAVLYGGYYGYGLGYYGGYRGYYGYAGLPYYAHAGLPYSYGWTDGPNNGLGPHLLGKREAEAEPEAEADPAVLYGGYYGYGLGYYGGYRGYYGYAGLPYYAHAGLPYSYGWTDGPNNGLGPHLLGKREAEAEPEAEADPAVLYGGYYGYGLGYYGGYRGYYSPYYAGYYAHAGLPYSYGWTDGPNNGLGPHLLGKREAEAEPEAEADPAVLYGGYYGYGLGYRGYYGYGLPYYAHAGLPYSYGWTDGPNNGLGPHLLGKREAEAEPEAEADPAVLYGGYYGYGLGYRGYYGYGYGLPYYAHAGLPYSYGWTDGPNNGLGPYYGK